MAVVVAVDGATLRLQDGIEPMWEDERNKRGGRWLITLNKQQRRLDLDRFWLETVRFRDALDGSEPNGAVPDCRFCSLCSSFSGGLFTPMSVTVGRNHVSLERTP